MITKDKVTEIFCILDEFCKYSAPELKNIRLTPQASVAVTVCV